MVSEIMKLLAQADGEVGGAILKEYACYGKCTY